jgi:hypothetical protein
MIAMSLDSPLRSKKPKVEWRIWRPQLLEVARDSLVLKKLHAKAEVFRHTSFLLEGGAFKMKMGSWSGDFSSRPEVLGCSFLRSESLDPSLGTGSTTETESSV